MKLYFYTNKNVLFDYLGLNLIVPDRVVRDIKQFRTIATASDCFLFVTHKKLDKTSREKGIADPEFVCSVVLELLEPSENDAQAILVSKCEEGYEYALEKLCNYDMEKHIGAYLIGEIPFSRIEKVYFGTQEDMDGFYRPSPDYWYPTSKFGILPEGFTEAFTFDPDEQRIKDALDVDPETIVSGIIQRERLRAGLLNFVNASNCWQYDSYRFSLDRKLQSLFAIPDDNLKPVLPHYLEVCDKSNVERVFKWKYDKIKGKDKAFKKSSLLADACFKGVIMENNSLVFDFTPDPKVLIALSHTSMTPMDALCELIDNAIDSFGIAKIQGVETNNPSVWVDIPKKTDIERNIGVLRVRDNGPGMTSQQAEKAIKAGYSGNNSFDSLGLFGMGFNISTSKFGRITRFMTARPADPFYTQTTIDLERITATRSYQLQADRMEKSGTFTQGTIIEINGWWPDGNANSGFIKKLIQYGMPRIREELGRRYATILRAKDIRLVVNGIPCEPFEHCVWSSERYVERNGKKIPARFDFDVLVGEKRRCSACRTFIPDGVAECPNCHSTSIRTVEERVKGWVGIQRFDDSTKFGIDLIRNGRAIRLAEKTAFFEYVDDLKNVTKDYPIDGPYGRIVGEVHLDFVPVDFLKQDFQRSSDEWVKAMKVLRGESSLQPKQPGADKNTSYIFKLYQGYRKVREAGKTDLYMGFWDPVEHKPKRISRDVEKEYYDKFLKHIPGYYDDTEWYAISDLPKVEMGEGDDIIEYVRPKTYKTENQRKYVSIMRGDYEDDIICSRVPKHLANKVFNDHNISSHKGPGHVKRKQQLLSLIPKDSTMRETYKRLEASGELAQYRDLFPKTIYGSRNRRLHWDEPSFTVTSHCLDEILHPVLNRAITPREAARLQSFPDWYQFAGPYVQFHGDKEQDKYEQIGDAIPPLLACAMARQFVKILPAHK